MKTRKWNIYLEYSKLMGESFVGTVEYPIGADEKYVKNDLIVNSGYDENIRVIEEEMDDT